MNREELISWKSRYNKEQDDTDKSEERELSLKIQKKQYITKKELEKIIKWKFQNKLIGRQKILLNHMKPIEESIVIEISKTAFKINDDEYRLKLLNIIKGIGNSLASVILTFYDPQNYGILDIHAWRSLFGENKPKSSFSNVNCLKFFEKLRQVSKITGLTCRDVEKAYYMKDFKKS